MSRATIPSLADGTNRASIGATEGMTADSAGLDLRGVRCPLSWVRAKLHLERLGAGQELRVRVDDPKGARDIPRAAEAEGYAVLATGEDGGGWWILIQK